MKMMALLLGVVALVVVLLIFCAGFVLGMMAGCLGDEDND